MDKTFTGAHPIDKGMVESERILIKDIGPVQERVSHEEFAKALGAEDTGMEINTKQSPISLFALRQFITKHLRSTGGRPALDKKTSKRSKISLMEGDWEKLKEIAQKECASPSQIAAILLHQVLQKVS